MSDPSDGGDGDSALPQGDRLQILSPEELDLLWGRPRFSRSEREIFFALPGLPVPLMQKVPLRDCFRINSLQAYFPIYLFIFSILLFISKVFSEITRSAHPIGRTAARRGPQARSAARR